MMNSFLSFFMPTRSTGVSRQTAFAVCLLMVGVSVLWSSGIVYAADDADSRLRQLEGSIDTLNRAVFDGKSPAPTPLSAGASSSSSALSSDYQASVETRLSELEQQLRDMTGKVEQLGYENQQLKTKLDKALTDLNLRLQDMAAAPATSPSSEPSSPASPSSSSGVPDKQSGTLAPNDMGGAVTPSVPVMPKNSDLKEPPPKDVPPKDLSSVSEDYNAPASQDSPTVKTLGEMTEAPGGASVPPKAGQDAAGLYESSFSLLKAGNYASAKTGFEQFLKKYPEHPLVSNATYWLGESYYAQGDYQKSARIFAESYKKYPKGPKAADSLLKMGMSLGGADKKSEACVTLGQIRKQFPSGDAVTLRRADQEMARLDCES